jgi:ribonuclease H / adenosylcobalamin/alpha-ribazole phosphatase
VTSTSSGRRLIVEADGGSRGNPGPAGYGALVRDAGTGEVLAEIAGHIGRATNNVAEYRGLVAGLEAARRIDLDAVVEVRMDSKLVVEQMSGRWRIKHPDMRPLALAAKRVFPEERVTYTWVPRERNVAADRLANEALDAAGRGERWRPRESRRTPDRSPAANRSAVVDEAEPETPAPTTLLLVRHGQTEHTVAKVFSGSAGADPPLTEAGRRQAKALAMALASRTEFAGIVSSPLRRAVETAEVVAETLGLPVRVDDGFAECAFGEWEGLTFAEVRERWPAALDGWLGSTAVAPPGGESFDEVAERVRLARDKALARYAGRPVVVVSHVTPVKQLVRLALEAPPIALFRMHLDPASLTTLYCYADGNVSLRSYNDTGHLR